MSFQIDVRKHLLYEDEYILVLYKPAGLMVEPDRNGHPNLLHQVRRYLKSLVPAGEAVYAQHLHRLDRPVSGIILFARRREVLHTLSDQFAQRTVKKYYQALTTYAPSQPAGVLEHWHRKEKKKAVIEDVEAPGLESIRLDYTVKPQGDNRFLWDVTLHTGKYHQIRSQLAHVGCPIIGDSLYGSSTAYKPDAIALHACGLGFIHPVTGKALLIERPHPF
ncbi:RluA family pseudouridine synthase [Fulvivirgaceae bacterium PWU5]|uniref:RluA family pseudouridine synthase n=1 Tax=Dawidia cretensis TaxID=2782350 RepID=A0AAP2GNY6_9BACT|nr:RluA family pseudouridine synthase [Dawidia cretensis]MBT1707729.1 RluA family pseudouridine synthase [Dawidia cretensis]